MIFSTKAIQRGLYKNELSIAQFSGQCEHTVCVHSEPEPVPVPVPARVCRCAFTIYSLFVGCRRFKKR